MVRDIQDIYPLSPTQHGMLFHSLYQPKSGVYVDQLTFTMYGSLNTEIFKKSWQYTIMAHSILRTEFNWEGFTQPVQIVKKEVPIALKLLDWSLLTEKEQKTRLEDFLKQDRMTDFDMTEAPLMRIYLIRMGKEQYELVWSYHHLLLDGWSVPLVIQDVFSFYDQQVNGEEPNLYIRRQFREYITWLRRQDKKDAEIYWKKVLKGFNAPTALVVDRMHNTQESKKDGFEKHELRLTVSETSDLQSWARIHQLTLNTLVQAAWGLLLSRYNGKSDVMYGATLSGRPSDLSGVESMVGMFINTMPVRMKIFSNRPLLEWLEEVQMQFLDIKQYEYTSLIEIHEWSDIQHGESLFESILVFENYPVSDSFQEASSQLKVDRFKAFEQTNYPLTIIASPGQELYLSVTYDRSRFDEDTIERMLMHLKTILIGMMTCGDGKIIEVPWLTKTEKHQLLFDWNNTYKEYPDRNLILQQLVERQVKEKPSEIAVVFEENFLTYEELNSRANQVAHHLLEMGIKRNQLIGISMERSFDMVIGLLGILKAGGAYVPLDPTYPNERLSFMLNDSGLQIVLTQSHIEKQLPSHGAHFIILDTNQEIYTSDGIANPNIDTTPTDLAYMIYTSGSTGKPKGAMISHRSIVNRLLWMQDQYQLMETDRVLQKTPFSFDVSVWEFFWPLMTGAQLVLAKPDGHKDSSYLVDVITSHRITVMHFVPSMLQVFLEDTRVETCNSLRMVMCSGEALPYELKERFFEIFSVELHNLYGPTEAAVDVSYWACQMGDHRKIIPIGRPVANTQLYILDTNLQPLPIGVPGELYIGGYQVGEGYYNRPELTSKKFILDPFRQEQNAKLYRTGDLARYLPDGTIQYLGRMDHQVKIRGFRIELGEVEFVLEQAPMVQQSVVIAYQDSNKDNYLVAYILPKKNEVPNIKELKYFLKQRLPEFMVPSVFMILEKFPLSPNGKVDRRAFPNPENKGRLINYEYVPPRNTFEILLTQIWEEVLQKKPIGIHDNFFDLGGHSLLAVRLMVQLQKRFDIRFPLSILFEAPTIEELAIVLSKIVKKDTSPLVALRTTGSLKPIFFVHPAMGNVLCYSEILRHIDPERPVYAFQASGLYGGPIYNQIEEMAKEYLKYILEVQPEGPYYISGYCWGSIPAFEISSQLKKLGKEVGVLALLDPGSAPNPDRELSEVFGWAFFLYTLFKSSGKEFPEIALKKLEGMELEERVAFIMNQTIQAELIPPEFEKREMTSWINVFLAHQEAMNRYRPTMYPDSITILQANSLEDITGWGQFSKKPIKVLSVPGNHYTMIQEPHAKVLAETLNQVCNEVTQRIQIDLSKGSM